MKQDLMQRNRNKKSKGLTFDDIAKAKAKLDALGPVAIAVWFVDCEELWRQFEQQLQTVAISKEAVRSEVSSPIPYFPPGVPIRHFKMADLDPETELIDSPSRGGGSMFTEDYRRQFKKVWPYICAFPGVWIEMNNKTYRRQNLR